MVAGDLNHFQYMELILWLTILRYLEKVMVSPFLAIIKCIGVPIKKKKKHCIGARVSNGRLYV